MVPPRISFAQYLSSSIVTLLIGSGENETILTAHQALLVQSPFFAEARAEFADDGSVGFRKGSSVEAPRRTMILHSRAGLSGQERISTR